VKRLRAQGRPRGRIAAATLLSALGGLSAAARGRIAAVTPLSALGLAIAVVGALALAPAAGAAQCPKTTLADVEADVMCPTCGTPLALASEAPQAIRQRALIERLIERCRSKREIEDVLVAEFGPGVLALPEADGFNLSAYLVPALGLLLAAAGVGAAARRWRRDGRAAGDAAASGDEPAGDDPAAAERLDADLKRYEL
jgi:cytochrome c-type biogenesis protein CcmH